MTLTRRKAKTARRPGARKRKPRGPKEAAKRLTVELRQVKVIELCTTGLTLRAMAQQLGVSYETIRQDRNDVLAKNAEHGTRAVNELRQLEGGRLDAAQVAIWPKVIKGDLMAMNTFLRISSTRAQLFGLNMPTRVSIAHERPLLEQLPGDELPRALANDVAAVVAGMSANERLAFMSALGEAGLLPPATSVH